MTAPKPFPLQARDLMAPYMDMARKANADAMSAAGDALILTLQEEMTRKDLSASMAPRLLVALNLAILEPLVRDYPVHSIAHLVESPDMARQRMALERKVGISAETMRLSQLLMWAQAHLEKEGSHLYEVSAGLGDRLLHTELSGLYTEDLQVPYPTIYVAVPRPVGEQLRLPVQGGTEPLVGVYLVQQDLGDGIRMWTMGAHGDLGSLWTLTPHAVPHSSMVFQVGLLPGLPLEANLEQAKRRLQAALRKHSNVDNWTGDKLLHWEPIYRFLCNLLVYLTLPEARAEEREHNPEVRALQARLGKLSPGPKRDHLKDRLKALARDRRVYVGDGISYEGTDTSVPGGRSPTVATRVTGHWRNQPHGPGRALRRRQWIEPFWRNLDGLQPASITHVAS